MGSNGSINYQTYATSLITKIFSGDLNSQMSTLKLGDWVSNKDPKFGKATRPSDFALNHFEKFRSVFDWFCMAIGD